MFSTVAIIPTGDELVSGIIKDTDSPELMSILLDVNPCAKITKCAPVVDQEVAITASIKDCVRNGYDLVIIIGGSGEGHRHSSILGKDFTHNSLEAILDAKYSTKIYGKNGHMWSELIIGTLENSLVFNVPGPYEEVVATVSAFTDCYQKNPDDIQGINMNMVQALKAKYGA